MKIEKFLAVGAILSLLVFFGYPFGRPGVAFGKMKSMCHYGLSLDKAASILRVAPRDLNQRSYELPVSPENQKNRIYKVPPCRYTYRSKTNFVKSISYTVYEYTRSGKAWSVFETMKDNFKTVAKVEMVPGLGEAAFWVNDKRFHRLVVLKDKIMMDVVSPKNLALQKQVVRVLMGK